MEDEGRRGFGGGGVLLGVKDDETDSPEVLRRATGFLGGGGAALPEALNAEFVASAWVSVFTLRRAGDELGSSSESRSIRFSTDLVAGESVFRGGRLGRTSGWSSSMGGNIDFDLRLSASSKSLIDAWMAALSSGSSSSNLLEELAKLLGELPLPLGNEEGVLSLPVEPTEGSKKPPPSGVVTSRMKTAITRPGFSSTKSVYTSRSASPLSPTRMKLRSGKSRAILSRVLFFLSATGSKMP